LFLSATTVDLVCTHERKSFGGAVPSPAMATAAKRNSVDKREETKAGTNQRAKPVRYFMRTSLVRDRDGFFQSVDILI